MLMVAIHDIQNMSSKDQIPRKVTKFEANIIRERQICRPGQYIGLIFGFYRYIGIGRNG